MRSIRDQGNLDGRHIGPAFQVGRDASYILRRLIAHVEHALRTSTVTWRTYVQSLLGKGLKKKAAQRNFGKLRKTRAALQDLQWAKKHIDRLLHDIEDALRQAVSCHLMATDEEYRALVRQMEAGKFLIANLPNLPPALRNTKMYEAECIAQAQMSEWNHRAQKQCAAAPTSYCFGAHQAETTTRPTTGWVACYLPDSCSFTHMIR